MPLSPAGLDPSDPVAEQFSASILQKGAFALLSAMLGHEIGCRLA